MAEPSHTVEVERQPTIGSRGWPEKCVVCMLTSEDKWVAAAAPYPIDLATTMRGGWELCGMHAKRFDRLRADGRLVLVALVQGR